MDERSYALAERGPDFPEPHRWSVHEMSEEPPSDPPTEVPVTPPLPPDPRDRHRPGDAVTLGKKAWADPADLRWHFTRGGGPGGQHVNKTATRSEVRLHLDSIGGVHPDAIVRIREQAGHLLIASSDELRIVSDSHRSQLKNREACLARLVNLIEQCEVRPKVRRKTRPTRASRERRLKDKKQRSEKKENRRWRDRE